MILLANCYIFPKVTEIDHFKAKSNQNRAGSTPICDLF
jgi:hypothetical protein